MSGSHATSEKRFLLLVLLLIAGAFRDCIHPHADAIYRSGADVRVSPSFDDEINKLRRTAPGTVVLDGPAGSPSVVFSPVPDTTATTVVGVTSRQSASWRPAAEAEVAANRSKIDWPGSGREPATWPDAGRLICNRVGSGRRRKLTSSVGDISRQTRAAHVTMRRPPTDCMTIVFAGYKCIDLSACLSMIKLKPPLHTRWQWPQVHPALADTIPSLIFSLYAVSVKILHLQHSVVALCSLYMRRIIQFCTCIHLLQAKM